VRRLTPPFGFLLLSGFDFSSSHSPFLPPHLAGKASGKHACALATLRASASAGAALRVLAPPFRPLQKRQPLVWRTVGRSPVFAPQDAAAEKEITA